MNNTLLIDINHTRPATAQASSNIIRCALAATAVAILEEMFKGMGIGWTFTLLGLLIGGGSGGLYWAERKWGWGWRVPEKETQKEDGAQIRNGDGRVEEKR